MSRWSEYKDKNGVTPLDALNPATKKASLEISDLRYSICQSCDSFNSVTTQCKECKCFMKFKTTYYNARCPLAKWGGVDD